tara:strand:+ start:231 stop:410 length:180 start_codon:yes stop_codon:yes gene_type:complete
MITDELSREKALSLVSLAEPEKHLPQLYPPGLSSLTRLYGFHPAVFSYLVLDQVSARQH